MTANFFIGASTNEAMELAKDGTKMNGFVQKWPWRDLQVGQSFYIDAKTDPVKLQTMQSSASRWSKKLGRRFRVVKHDQGIEVARLPDIVSTEEQSDKGQDQ